MTDLTIDFESRSFVDLKASGAAVYAEHDSTEILCMSYKFGDGGSKLWTPFLPFPQEIIDHIRNGGYVRAHNVAFEWHVWFNQLYKKGIVDVMPSKWRCSLAACAYRSIPLALDKAGDALDLPIQKDSRGKYLLNQLTKPKKPTKKIPHWHFREDWDLLNELYEYCLQDSDSEHALETTIGDLPPSEQQVWALDRKINMRGMHVDMHAVKEANEICTLYTNKLTKELVELTGGKVNSGKEVKKFVEWFNEQGLPVDNMRKDTVEQLLDNPIDLSPDVIRVLQLRQVLSKSSISKLDKFMAATCEDGRIREMLQYHGAGTGRFAGRLIQPQNFPRGGLKAGDFDSLFEILHSKITIEEKLAVMEMLFGDPLEAVSSGLRGMFTATPGKRYLIADFAAIEARVVMWVAQCQHALEAFHAFDRGEGPDIYCVMAESLYGYPVNKKDHPDERTLGKVTILGCGYQMGPPRFQEQALSDYGLDLPMSVCEKAVYGYRDTYPEVKNLWYGLQEAAMWAVINKGESFYKGIRYKYIEDAAGPWLACILPNGRHLWYYRPEVNQVYKFEQWMPELSYMGRDNKKQGAWSRVSTYGGMLTENVVQAIARDLMIDAMFRVEEKGYEILLTVHDEILAEADEGFGSLQEFLELMKGPVSHFFDGCPVNVEGAEVYRYRKI